MNKKVEIKEAVSIVLESVLVIGTERIALEKSYGRVLRQHAVSDCDIPTSDVSTMDGFAVRRVDVENVGPETPAKLSVIETIGAGTLPTHEVLAGQAARIMTGAVVPPGADCVVRSEDTSNGDGETVLISVPMRGGKDNIRKRGEEIKNGDVVIQSGSLLTPRDLGFLASTGHTHVDVSKCPVVGILVTGSEIVEVGAAAAAGMVRNSNGYVLSAMCEEAGTIVAQVKIVKDDAAEIEKALEETVATCDIVITTGGVSRGQFDLVRGAVEKLGRVLFEQVNMKPGRGTVFGLISGKPVFGLPGGPGANIMGMELFVYPAIMKMMDAAEGELSRMTGVPADGCSVKDFSGDELVPAVAKREGRAFVLYPYKKDSMKPNCMVFSPHSGTENVFCGVLEFFLLSPVR